MPNYAISNGEEIINVIIADSKEIAEKISGMEAIETNGYPWVGATLENGLWNPNIPGWTLEEDGWRPPKPYNSWAWNGLEWIAPKPRPIPNDEYYWDENVEDWINVKDEIEDLGDV